MTSFRYLVHAEWTKFRTVRGWVIAVLVTVVTITAFTFLAADVSGGCTASNGASRTAACPASPAGPDGEPVVDAFYLVHQPATRNGTITAQVTSLAGQVAATPAGYVSDGSQIGSGLQPWSKAGIIIKENTSPGSAYAALMVTGSHGVRMQWDYVHDTPGLAGSVSAATPRWLRLTRSGDVIRGYDSADGTHWTLVGTVTLRGLTSTVQAGLFAAGSSVNSNFGALATAAFRHIGLSWPATGWTGTNVGGSNAGPAPGTLRQRAGALTVAGYGDVAPAAGNIGGGQSVQRALAGTFVGLIPLIVVAAMFITGEYRRGLIRVSLTAAPRRGQLLAAKAVVIGAVGFVAGLAAAALALAVGTPLLRRSGGLAWPVSRFTEVRMVVGTGALLAVAAVLALAIGTIVRRSTAAVAIVIAVTVVPYLFVLGPLQGANDDVPLWPLRITPGRRLVRTAGGSAVLPAHRRLPAERRVLPAPRMGGAGGGVRVGGGRAGAGLLLAAPQRRMSLTARVPPPGSPSRHLRPAAAAESDRRCSGPDRTPGRG